MKTCTKCGVERDESRFSVREYGDGVLSGTCKNCRAAVKRAFPKDHPSRIKQRERQRRVRMEAPGYLVEKTYGLKIEEFDEMVLRQGGMCGICEESTKLCVDHDHVTGRVRALLCRNCNVAIGMLRDSRTLVQKAADYLSRFV